MPILNNAQMKNNVALLFSTSKLKIVNLVSELNAEKIFSIFARLQIPNLILDQGITLYCTLNSKMIKKNKEKKICSVIRETVNPEILKYIISDVDVEYALIYITVVIIAKYHLDTTYSNFCFAKIAGIDLDFFNHIEIFILKAIDYDFILDDYTLCTNVLAYCAEIDKKKFVARCDLLCCNKVVDYVCVIINKFSC